MSQPDAIDRRAHERFALPPMYTAVTAQRNTSGEPANLMGHAYDICEQGVRIELDEPLDPGETIALQLALPGATTDIYATAQVVWAHDADDDPGPRRMALRFTEFLTAAHRYRLIDYLGSGYVSRAA